MAHSRTVIIGGGAAGFFTAVNLKEMMPSMDVTIFEKSRKVLAKVEVSGGGRCNCTNTFEGVVDLREVYPRGHRLMKRLFNLFDYRDAYRWFEEHGVPLTVQPDHCVFPKAQDSHAIIHCLTQAAADSGVHIELNRRVASADDIQNFDYAVVSTGGSPSGRGLHWLKEMGHETVEPVPSLFPLAVDDPHLNALQGIVAERAAVQLPGTKIRTEGPLLITHWGLSGPAILKLSSHAARELHAHQYQTDILVNWAGLSEAALREAISECCIRQRMRQVAATPIGGLSHRLWQYVVEKALVQTDGIRWCDIGKKDTNRLVNTLCNDMVTVAGRAPFKDEFVTCGGIALSNVHLATLESKVRKGLYFAGEVLDVDGVTGGFNFQAAWTTAYTVARSITAAAQAVQAP